MPEDTLAIAAIAVSTLAVVVSVACILFVRRDVRRMRRTVGQITREWQERNMHSAVEAWDQQYPPELADPPHTHRKEDM